MSGASTEVRLARKLASNDPRTRKRALKSLQAWMKARSQCGAGICDAEMLKVWKGLYVCMWHSDKPLVQEEVADAIAGLVHVVHERETALQFLRGFFLTMSREWHGIDHLRLDKFYMLIRRVLRHSFLLLRSAQWQPILVQELASVYANGVLCPNTEQICSGVQLHVVEVYLPELLVVGARECPGDCALTLLWPCLTLLAQTRNASVAEAVRVNVLEALVRGCKASALQMKLAVLSDRLLQLAIDQQTVGANRKTLYTFRRRLAGHHDTIETETAKKPKYSPRQTLKARRCKK